ncbi:hypothetical protein ILUMI_06153 [Ignelater luminosus]|uniref:Uncharacterized protein n=1 Tax=Ignelater luminosus TaxID=2038154 RepID=A0A8K0D930_IGNLU|nr:hypothetical protein ILUMI_06153 [Ignelater luminosus]
MKNIRVRSGVNTAEDLLDLYPWKASPFHYPKPQASESLTEKPPFYPTPQATVPPAEKLQTEEENMKKRYKDYLEKHKKSKANYQNIEERYSEYKQSLIKAAKENCGVTEISNKHKKRTPC